MVLVAAQCNMSPEMLEKIEKKIKDDLAKRLKLEEEKHARELKERETKIGMQLTQRSAGKNPMTMERLE